MAAGSTVGVGQGAAPQFSDRHMMATNAPGRSSARAGGGVRRVPRRARFEQDVPRAVGGRLVAGGCVAGGRSRRGARAGGGGGARSWAARWREGGTAHDASTRGAAILRSRPSAARSSRHYPPRADVGGFNQRSSRSAQGTAWRRLLDLARGDERVSPSLNRTR
jgi:hypothetical protein